MRVMALAGLVLVSVASGEGFEEGMALKKSGQFLQAAHVFSELVKKNPKDADALEQLATVQGWSGNYADAVRSWEKAIAARPGNYEYRIGLARVLYWKGDAPQARAELAVVIAQQPKNADAWILKGDILMAVEKPDQARAAYVNAKALAPNDPDIDKKLARAAPTPRWRLDAGYVADKYTNFRRHEYGAYGQIGYLFNRSDTLWVRYDYLKQFSQYDRTTQVGGAFKAARSLLIMGGAGLTHQPHFRPNFQAELGGELSLIPYLTQLLAYRQYRYGDGDVRVLIPGARLQFVPWFNAEARYSVSRNLDKTTTNAFSVRLNGFIGEAFAPYLAYAHGVENLPPQATARVSYYAVGSVWNVTPRWGIRLDYGYEDRPEFYRHGSLGGGVTARF